MTFVSNAITIIRRRQFCRNFKYFLFEPDNRVLIKIRSLIKFV